jgi:hypothetical protein
MLTKAIQDGTESPTEDKYVIGLFTDRLKIARLLVRRYIVGADHIRDVMRRTHWYQGAFNDMLFEGWEEGTDERGRCHFYRLELEAIDNPG